MTNINDVVDNAHLLVRIQKHTFGGSYKSLVGDEQYQKTKDYLYEKLVTKRVESGKNPSAIYLLLKNYENTSYYSWAVDAVAQNVASLPFIINDMYAPLKYVFEAVLGYTPPPDNTFLTACATRGNAFVGNAVIGDGYRVWQDYLEAYMDVKLNISGELNKYKKAIKKGAVDSLAFVTGQSWIYAGFLFGGNVMSGKETDLETLVIGVISLSVFAPIIGPWTSKVYKKMRKWLKLPPKADFKLDYKFK